MPRSQEPLPHRKLAFAAVSLQLILLALVFVIPFPRLFTMPEIVRYGVVALNIVGWTFVLLGFIGLGRSLTPLPFPRKYAMLQTSGIYRFSRHPIYGGVVLLALARSISSGSIVTAICALLLAGLLASKARWEESLLRLQYAGYDDYKRRTRMFF